MKKLIALLLFVASAAFGQTFQVQNLNVNGTGTFTTPIAVSSGGIGTGTASGTALDNITGFNGTGFMSRSGAGSYTFSSRINLTNLANQAANTVVANVTSASTTPTAFAMPSCSTSASAINYTTNTGFGCNTAINAATLGGATFAAPGPIGSTTPGSGAFTTLSATTGASIANGLTVSSGGASVTGGLLLPTAVARGNNSTQAASTAFVAASHACANIMDFGGDPTGVSANDTAFVNALSSPINSSNLKCVEFPPGTFIFSAQAGFTFSTGYQSVTVKGAGQDNTVLSWAGGGGIAFNLKTGTDSVHIQDLTVTSGTTNTGQGITLTNSFAATSSAAMNTIERVAVRGSDGYFGTDYFAVGIDIVGVSSVNIDSVQVIGPGTAAGIGLFIGSSNSVVPIVYNISNSSFNNWADGFEIGNLTQGVQVTNCNFTNDSIGIFVPASETGLDQLSVSNSQFNSLASNPNILINSAIANVSVTGNVFLINNNSSGVNIQATSTTTITGNLFEPNTGSPTNVFGVILNGWVVGASMVTGNNFYNVTTGITLQASSKNVNVQSNVYNSCTANTSNAGTGNVIGGGSA